MPGADRWMVVRRTRFLPALTGRVPWSVSLLIGLASVLLGVLLVRRPLSSLSTLALYIGLSFIAFGVTDLLAIYRSRAPGLQTAVALAWLMGGVAVLLRLGTAIEALPTFIAAVLLLTGLARLVAARHGTADQRLSTALLGIADVVFGVLALRWPDVTMVVVAVLFGARTVLFGVSTVWSSISRARRLAPVRDGVLPGSRRRTRWRRSAGAAVAVALAAAAGLLGHQLRAGSPLVDGFYTAPADVPVTPGVLLRSEPFVTDVPAGATAWRILYTTTQEDGEPTLGSGIVLVAADAPEGPRPVIAWAHGTTGFATHCAPTLLSEPLAAGALPALEHILSEGWILVATDYAGLGTTGPQPYLIGEGQARSVLDSVRAARQLDGVLMADETVVWGHSQGGHAALWTGQVAPRYAPDVHVTGVAAMAPASDPIALTASLPGVRGGSVFGAYVVMAYTETYQDVSFEHYIRPSARTLVREMGGRCLSEPGVYVSVLTALALENDVPVYRRDPTTGPFGDRLRENTPLGPIPAPLLIAQGSADSLITPGTQEAYTLSLCASGQQVDYRAYDGRDHMGLVADDSPLVDELVAWTQQRLVGAEPASTCPSE